MRQVRRRGFCPIAAALLSAALLLPDLVTAQPTIRLSPDPAIFPDSMTYSTLNISVFIDGITAPGIRAVSVLLDSRARGKDGAACVTLHPADLGTIDQDLVNAWGRTFTTLQTHSDYTQVRWTLIGERAFIPPTGTIRLGNLRYRVRMGRLPVGCFEGMQDHFRWVRDETLWGAGVTADQEFALYRGAPWILIRAPSVDLSLSCTRSSTGDPNFFVDGDFLTLGCDVTNTGFDKTQVIPTVEAFFSKDEIITGLDAPIVKSVEAGAILGRSFSSMVMSAQPIQTTPQVINICTKVDVDPNYLDNYRGLILETNEDNNVECSSITVIRPHRDMVPVPGSIMVAPDPRDPNQKVRAGLNIGLTYDVLNQGIAAVRYDHRNSVYIGSDLDTARVDPNGLLCGMTVSGQNGLPQVGGETLTHTFGLGTGSSPELCKIPFRYPEGPTSLFLVLDDEKTVNEEDPNFNGFPAEGNNTLEVPIQVRKPLDPELRVQHRFGYPNDHEVELFGPGTGTMLLTVASARGFRSYSASLEWSPVTKITLGDPNVPGGDPGGVEFFDFLEQGGLAQSCSVDGVDATAGTLDISCTTSDPSGHGAPAITEEPAILARLTWTTILPGNGTFRITSFSATDGDGLAYPGLRTIDGVFVVGGVPDMSVRAPISPAEVYPGVPFSASWEIVNDGFGTQQPPFITELVISRNDVLEYGDPNSPDFRACFVAESSPVPGKTFGSRTAPRCLVHANVRPGVYTGFYQVQLGLDPLKGETDLLRLPSRLVVLRRTSYGTAADTHRAPSQPGDSVGARLARGKGYDATSVASVGSVERNRNWLVKITKGHGGKRMLKTFELPLNRSNRLTFLRKLRIPKDDKRLLGAADIDGDGDQELIILQRRKKQERLDFRRIDFGKIFPLLCQSAAETDVFVDGILGATGVQYDADPEDELAVVTGDGALTIYDIELNGTLPPARPCDPIPVILYTPAEAQLIPLASDPAFSGPGETVRSLCAIDDGLDGTEELTALVDISGRRQAVRVFQVPAGPGGDAVLIADDPSFGGVDGIRRALDLSCTR